MAKVLITAHLGRHFRIFGHYDYKVLVDMGHEVHIAANFSDKIDNFDDERVIKHQIDFERNPFSIKNITAISQLKLLMKQNKFDLVHTQSPSGGAITRIATRKFRKDGTKVMYTAHGLHFFKGAPRKNWMIYFPIEKVLGLITDSIITINKEDLLVAKNKLKIKDVKYIPGVGIDLEKFKPLDSKGKILLRKKYGFDEQDFILIYVGELSYRKNQEFILKALTKLTPEISNLKLLLVGTGELMKDYQKKTEELNLENYVKFLGYRSDVSNLMQLSDVVLSSSKQEGLPVNLMEGMASGLPLVVTNCRGNRDLVKENINGFLIEQEDIVGFTKALNILYLENEKRKLFGKYSLKLIQKFSTKHVIKKMENIYSQILK